MRCGGRQMKSRKSARNMQLCGIVLSFLGAVILPCTFAFSFPVTRGLAARRPGTLICMQSKDVPSRVRTQLRCARGAGTESPVAEKEGKLRIGLDTSAAQPPASAELFGLPQKEVVEPLALLLAAQLVLFIGVGAVIPTLPLYGKAIGLSSATNGVVIAAPAVALLLGSRASGKFADVARKPAMIGGMALIAASDLGTAFATSLVPLIVARLGLGAGRIISESGERGMLADIASRVPALRGRALAAQQALSALGVAIGAPIGGMVVETYGPRAAFLCVTAAATAAMAAYTFLPETVGKPEGGGQAAAAAEGGEAGGREGSGEGAAGWRELLRDGRWQGLALCECGVRFGFAAKLASVPVLAAEVLPGGAVGAGALLSAAGLSGLLGAPIGGWLTDKVGAKATAIASGLLSAVGLLLVPAALAGGVLPELRGLPGGVTAEGAAFTGLIVAWSIGATAQGPALTAIAQELAPAGAEATAMALPRAAGDAVYIVAPFLLGLAADLGGMKGLDCAMAGGATLLGIAALGVRGAGRRRA